MLSIGVDVSKFTLSCARAQEVEEFPNSPSGLAALLAWGAGATTFCMEATGRYHEPLALAVHGVGKRCLVVNPAQAKKYLSFVDSRAKTDRVDALSLARLAEREGENLRAFRPVPEAVQVARDILVRRRGALAARVSLEQLCESCGDPSGHLALSIAALRSSVAALELELAAALKSYSGYQHLLSIPGIGPMSAALLVCTLERGEFASSDALVAFAGLDPRASDSGRHRGTRRLSHQGDAALRTTLFMAAMAGSRLPIWKPYYDSQLNKGLSSTAARVILARKLLRVAWSVYRQGGPFVDKNKPTT